MGLFDSIIEAASDVVESATDVVSDVTGDISDGNILGAVVEITTAGSLGLTEIGDILQDQMGLGLEAVTDFVQGEEVTFDFNPDEVMSDLLTAGTHDVEDLDNALGIISELGV